MFGFSAEEWAEIEASAAAEAAEKAAKAAAEFDIELAAWLAGEGPSPFDARS